MADIKQYVKSAEEKMSFAIDYLDEQLAHIRAGKANPKILDGVKVPYYGSLVPLSNVASVISGRQKDDYYHSWKNLLSKKLKKRSELGNRYHSGK